MQEDYLLYYNSREEVGGGLSQAGFVWNVQSFYPMTFYYYSVTYKRLGVGQGEMRDLRRMEV